MSELLGRPVQRNGGVLKGVALSLQQSATSMGKLIYRARSVEKLAQQTARVQAEHPEADVEVWTMDEHRLGASRCCGCGSRRGTTDCSGELAFSVAMAVFVHPQSGETYWWILPKVNINLFNRVLADFQTFWPWQEQANHFGDGSLAYKFASRSSRGYSFGVHAFPFTRTSTSRASL